MESWKKLLREGIGLSLIEYKQVQQRYQVTPLLREELLENFEERKVCHEIAFNYYKKICESMDSYDPILGEEWIFHALGCDKEAGVLKQIGNADYLEGELRNILAKGLYSEGKKYLKKAIEISPEIKERLKKEFGFIYYFDKLDKDEDNWEQSEAQIDWRRKVWQVLSIRSQTALELIETQENIKDLEKEKSESIVEVEKSESKVIKEKKTGKITSSGEKGEKLEKAVFILFKQFFERCEQENEKFQIKNVRQQGRGSQSGHDLKFVIGITGNRKMRILLECKNVAKKITKDNIGGKLLAAEAHH